jgi:hypothetical protein
MDYGFVDGQKSIALGAMPFSSPWLSSGGDASRAMVWRTVTCSGTANHHRSTSNRGNVNDIDRGCSSLTRFDPSQSRVTESYWQSGTRTRAQVQGVQAMGLSDVPMAVIELRVIAVGPSHTPAFPG